MSVLRDTLQELIEARKEDRKRKRAEGKGRGSAASWEENEEKLKLDGADSGFGSFENGDGPDHRWVLALCLGVCIRAFCACPSLPLQVTIGCFSSTNLAAALHTKHVVIISLCPGLSCRHVVCDCSALVSNSATTWQISGIL